MRASWCLTWKAINMKFSITLISLLAPIAILCTASQCHDDSISSGEQTSECAKGNIPSWINEIIANTEQSGSRGEIIRYKYEGQWVYFIDACVGCPDFISVVYDCQQNELCKFGGIAGFNTCPDFDQKARDKKVIWKN